MGNTEDVRWIQRLSNYNKALSQFVEAVNLALSKELSNLEKQGLIQAFEFTHELAWNVMKDFLEARGNKAIYGSRDATREAFQTELITKGDIWMDMIKSRNKTSHTYNEETANEIFTKIIEEYYRVFVSFQKVMQELEEKEEYQ